MRKIGTLLGIGFLVTIFVYPLATIYILLGMIGVHIGIIARLSWYV